MTEETYLSPACVQDWICIVLCFNSTRVHDSLSPILPYEGPVPASKTSSPDSVIQCFPFQVPVSSPFLKFIQYLLKSSSSSSRPFYLSFINVF